MGDFMRELYNQLQATNNPLEIIYLSDKFLDKQINGYIKLVFLKGEILLSLGRFDDALSVFEQILEYNQDSFAGRAHNSIGFCYSMKNEFDKANSEFEKARQYCDNSSLLLNSATLKLAAYYSMTNQKENTFKIFKELYDLDPSNGEGAHILFLTMANNPEELIGILNSTVDEINPVDVNVMFTKGETLLDLERYNDAIPVFEEILKYTDDKNVVGNVHENLGFCYSRIMELDKAICEFEKAREYSDEVSILFNLAVTYEMANQKEKALEVFKEFYEKFPYDENIKKKIENLELELSKKDSHKDTPFDSIEDALREADNHLVWERYEQAIEIYDLITDVMPEHTIAWNHKGSAYNEIGRYEEAIKCFDESLKYNPNFFKAWYNKAFVLDKLNRLDESLECYEKALELSPENPQILENMALIYTKKGDFDKALKILKRQ